jgi:hypothetical protein
VFIDSKDVMEAIQMIKDEKIQEMKQNKRRTVTGTIDSIIRSPTEATPNQTVTKGSKAEGTRLTDSFGQVHQGLSDPGPRDCVHNVV